ncbi:hypothetical protein SAMN05443572_11965 [Myxococcus fulvus]|uniref:AAA+ ATPase domain-containing protein n=1 Tax=Myxococcus fulvus TaxID=33 RepID=A0A511TG83_MYXFU|nr:ATP-binding protein [Myxococcus fulvus]GEN13187.1 hypothetical protein MFU01_82240 [Myxococcus fulvus]SEU42477.1 hypothetical protein SAMN05443572_11965 [Myxococcus fulvus]
MSNDSNPYRWDIHAISQDVEVIREQQLESVARLLRRGSGVVLLGGRGMGKSVFLRQLMRTLKSTPSLVVKILSPPVDRSLPGALANLAGVLNIDIKGHPPSAQEILERFFEREKHIQSIVLLFDELDQYAMGEGDIAGALGRIWFDHLEAARKNTGRLGLLAAGNLGMYLLRHSYSSSFLSRASVEKLLPFSEDELTQLATPVVRRNHLVDSNVLDAIRLVSGSNPALATYALEQLWSATAPTPTEVTNIYSGFQRKHPEFIRSSLKALTADELSGIPFRVLELIRKSDGAVPRKTLLQVANIQPSSKFDLEDTLTLLQSAGLIHFGGMVTDDPVYVRPVASLLNLANTSHFKQDVEKGLAEDLEELLQRMHAMGVDLLQASRQILPEAVYSAFLTLGLRLKGWEAEREAQNGAGRTDIKVKRPGEASLCIVEVKIWGRNDYKSIHDQVCAYWSSNVTAGFAIMLTEKELLNWENEYLVECLALPNASIKHGQATPPVRAHFIAESKTPDTAPARVHHFLLRIPRRS